jgi:hypothetical protein
MWKMLSILRKLGRGRSTDAATHHDYYGSTQRLRDDYDKPDAYAALCAMSNRRRARLTDVPILCCEGVPLGGSLATLRRAAGRPQQQVSRPNSLTRAIVVYRYQVDDYKCRLEIHCNDDGVFYAQRGYRHLSEPQRPKLLRVVADKYLGGDSLDAAADKLVDAAGNELFLTDDVALTIHYLGRGTRSLLQLCAAAEPA